MFGKSKLLAVIILAIPIMACDLESGNQGGGKIPGVPTNVRAVLAGPTSIKVEWNTVSGATDYDVFGEFGSTITMIITVKGNSYTDTGLQPNTTYNYYVTAKNSTGPSDLSTRASATTQSM